jgi:hypothetical protein
VYLTSKKIWGIGLELEATKVVGLLHPFFALDLAFCFKLVN